MLDTHAILDKCMDVVSTSGVSNVKVAYRYLYLCVRRLRNVSLDESSIKKLLDINAKLSSLNSEAGFNKIEDLKYVLKTNMPHVPQLRFRVKTGKYHDGLMLCYISGDIDEIYLYGDVKHKDKVC